MFISIFKNYIFGFYFLKYQLQTLSHFVKGKEFSLVITILAPFLHPCKFMLWFFIESTSLPYDKLWKYCKHLPWLHFLSPFPVDNNKFLKNMYFWMYLLIINFLNLRLLQSCHTENFLHSILNFFLSFYMVNALFARSRVFFFFSFLFFFCNLVHHTWETYSSCFLKWGIWSVKFSNHFENFFLLCSLIIVVKFQNF